METNGLNSREEDRLTDILTNCVKKLLPTEPDYDIMSLTLYRQSKLYIITAPCAYDIMSPTLYRQSNHIS